MVEKDTSGFYTISALDLNCVLCMSESAFMVRHILYMLLTSSQNSFIKQRRKLL